MDKRGKETKKILSHESIYKIMQWLPVIVAAVFFFINVKKGNKSAMLVIGLCLAAFVGMLIFVKVRNVSLYAKEYILSFALPVLVFMISLYSGECYSDDFPMFLAVIAMTGLYLEPKFTRSQIVFIDIILIAMYLIHPEKAESRSQYIMCYVIFNLAAGLFYQVIKRGRAFIEIGQERAEESEKLLESIRNMGASLQQDFAASSAKIEVSTKGLQEGSVSIARSSGTVSDSCNVVHGKIRETEAQIELLNREVMQFEDALTENKNNVDAMGGQVDSIGIIIGESAAQFRTMEGQMKEIRDIAGQINDIAFQLTLLAINASVEAAHAGEEGAGFGVLADKMRSLSENSSAFSERVSDVVKEMLAGVEKTSERFSGSETALERSQETMEDLARSFERLHQQFEMLYANIEQQNYNVNQIESIFAGLNQNVADMQDSSLANQDAVEAIVEAMDVFRGNVTKIVANTQTV